MGLEYSGTSWLWLDGTDINSYDNWLNDESPVTPDFKDRGALRFDRLSPKFGQWSARTNTRPFGGIVCEKGAPAEANCQSIEDSLATITERQEMIGFPFLPPIYIFPQKNVLIRRDGKVKPLSSHIIFDRLNRSDAFQAEMMDKLHEISGILC